MKPKLLIVACSPPTGIGLKSYLANIFSQYIALETQLIDDVTTELLERYDLVLLASKEARERVAPLLNPRISTLSCIRTLNFTYLNKVLSIPPNSDVYLVNDRSGSCESVIRLLKSNGFNQYHFIPYYPGCENIDENIQYAVTTGEGRHVPKHIPNVIDIGIRIPDLSTIAEIVSFFNLSMSLVDVITQNYINQFVQLLKISSHQLSQATNTKFITQSVISNIDAGICLVDSKGKITMINHSFIRDMDIKRSHLIGIPIKDVVPELGERLDAFQREEMIPKQVVSEFSVIKDPDKTLKLMLQKIQDTNREKLVLLHIERRMTGEDEKPANGIRSERQYYRFNDYRSMNSQVLRMLETARRASLTEYCVLLQGESGTGREVIAQAIHNNSSRRQKNFVRLNLNALSEEQIMDEFLAHREGSAIQRAKGGSLYLDGIHCLTEQLQRILLRLLESGVNVRLITATDQDLYEMCLAAKFQTELFYRLNEVALFTLPIRKRKEDIPLLFEYFMRNIYNNPGLSLGDFCSEELLNHLENYSWPGNGKEIENVCKYFYCVKSDRKLTTRELPPYIRSQMVKKEAKVSPMERQILGLINQYPKIGRSRLFVLMSENGMEITEGKIRSTLQSLAERGLIKMNRTKGGSEITEDGILLL